MSRLKWSATVVVLHTYYRQHFLVSEWLLCKLKYLSVGRYDTTMYYYIVDTDTPSIRPGQTLPPHHPLNLINQCLHSE